MNPYNFSVLCFGFCSFFVGLLIFLKRPDAVGKTYFVFTMFNSFWGIFFGIFWSSYGAYEKAVFYARLADTIAIYIPVTWLHFVVIYSGILPRYKKALWGLYAFSAALSLFGFSNLFVASVKPSPLAIYFTQPGIMFHVFLILYSVIIPLGFLFLFKKLNTCTKEEGKQLKGFMVATFLGFLGGGLTIPPGYDIYLPQYAVFLMPLYPFATAYFLIRKGLFNVEELAQAAHRDKLTAIGVLAASINHEVKNPLFIIKGLAENFLERQKEGIFSNDQKALENAQDAMKRSIEQADRAMDIIKRLSLFAKAGIESEIKKEPVRFGEVIEDILPLIRYELAAHSITLTRNIPSDLPEVLADQRYLEEILFNLFVNACQAIKETGKSGKIEITASSKSSVIPAEAGIQRLDPRLKHSGMTQDHGPSQESLSNSRGTRLVERGSVIITIRDTGPGIPEDKLKEVFRPFYTTKAEGTGLGLYITQQLVEKIRGRIDVQSEVGVGTTFTVLLPAYS